MKLAIMSAEGIEVRAFIGFLFSATCDLEIEALEVEDTDNGLVLATLDVEIGDEEIGRLMKEAWAGQQRVSENVEKLRQQVAAQAQTDARKRP